MLPPGASLLDVYASEISRFSSAAIETSFGISRIKIPKSTAWLFIQAYYAAFYAAHCILRSVGISASNLRATQCQKADQIAVALGFSHAPLIAAQFRCEYNVAAGRLDCVKAHGSAIHEQFWRIFSSFLDNAVNQILQFSNLPSADAQEIFDKLNELRRVLKSDGQGGGNWLSTIRNEVTYMQEHKAWFPYGRSREECDRLFGLQKEWLKSPESISINPIGATNTEIFVGACVLLVSLSISTIKDMAMRSIGRSFLADGPLRLLRQVSAIN